MEISLAGISTVTDDFPVAVSVTEKIKQTIGIPVIMGGAHVNVRPEESLKYADMICLGEGERAFLELLQKYSAKRHPDTDIQNIWFNTRDGVVRNELRRLDENLDRFPQPDFNLNDMYVMNESSFEKLNETHINFEYSVMTSRGCPYSCTYCYNSYRRRQYKGKGRYLRTRKIEKVIEELSIAKRTFKGLRKVNFMDDSFIARKMEDFEFFKNLYLEQINLPFFALAEPMAFDFEKVKILKNAGLSELQVGIQSGSERTNQQDYKRTMSNERVLKIARFINQLKIDVIYDLIFNNPYESREDLIETVDLLLKFPKPFSLQGYNLIFYPETQITDRALRDGNILVKEKCEDFSTIEGKGDSPITAGGQSKISSRFYTVNYNSGDKDYYNSVISLMAYNHVPKFIIRFFRLSDKGFMPVLLRLFYKSYNFAHDFKQFLKI
jgi:anaerobic magnesium-protoporphyrin IX monomethyl ester cyclase